MAITQAMCTSFKKELMTATHNFTATSGNTFRLALYTSSASLDASTTAYTTSNEVSGTGYTAKGGSLTRVDPSTSGTTALTDFADLMNQYEKRYLESISRLKVLGEGDNTVDIYRDDMLRVERT